jgi:hypothetical protein
MAKDWFLLSPCNVIKHLANRTPCFKYCAGNRATEFFNSIHPLRTSTARSKPVLMISTPTPSQRARLGTKACQVITKVFQNYTQFPVGGLYSYPTPPGGRDFPERNITCRLLKYNVFTYLKTPSSNAM